MSSFFSRTKYVEGADVEDMKITFENIFAELRDSRYDDGIEVETTIAMIMDIYKYVTGTSHGKALSLPAPALNPDDKYRTMWPEGTKVRTRSRRDSHTSRASSVASNGVRVPKVAQGYTNSRASSTTSSKYAPVRAKFMEDEIPEEGVRSLNMREIRNTAPVVPRNSGSGILRSTAYPGTTGRRNESYQPEEEPVMMARPAARPRFMQQPVEEEEVEHIDTRTSMPRQRVREQRVQDRRSNRPTFIEDE
jgi:hypothetical protein